jgi:hypothetical protein
MISAVIAALLLWVVFSAKTWRFPWYYFFSILAGELLLIFAAGFLSSFLLLPFTARGTTLCKECGASMFFAGRHFDPLGSPRPHWTDVVIFIVFIGVNVAFWFALASNTP